MRITTITNNDQRVALNYAAEAARLIVDRVPGAVLAEVASEPQDDAEVRMYDLFNVWGDVEMDGHRMMLWTDLSDEDPIRASLVVRDSVDAIRTVDRDAIRTVLELAGETDPNVFGPGELASGSWELDIPAVLAKHAEAEQWAKEQYEAAKVEDPAAVMEKALWTLNAKVAELDLEVEDLYGVVHDALSEGAAADDEDDINAKAAQVNGGGQDVILTFLVEKLGLDAALAEIGELAIS